ncbi:hypothetical protein WR25_00300 [Diploscapter pachys]|uniref:Kinesin motor domain-containing protein n=1 Tax=Diploscapter pachys TaxID=2018661 RepID=A0A2A2J6V8_9BILA|nr:hypothetical protein WR25_00300 [Diploscapter pachys]
MLKADLSNFERQSFSSRTMFRRQQAAVNSPSKQPPTRMSGSGVAQGGGNDLCAVQVLTRARPFSTREITEGARTCVEFDIENSQIYCNGVSFAFDAVFTGEHGQECVYATIGTTILEKLMKGFHCTILAYGQTGSGKTYTMGTEHRADAAISDDRGIVPRLVQTVFQQINESENPSSFKVSVSMLEIYDEKVIDLLSGGKEPLPIREDQSGSVFVKGLTTFPVENVSDTVSQLEKGCQSRSKGETAMNAQSSRSHAIFSIILVKEAVTEEDLAFTAKLQLVDLAGSERLKKTQAEGDRKKEGIRINEGLLALGNVISALAKTTEGKKLHIPYRDSTITRLLQDSLGGNSFTVMIACISPADTNAEETLSTLRYADRAKQIKNKPRVNANPKDEEIRRLRETVARQSKELAELRAGIVPSETSSGDTAKWREQVELAKMEAQAFRAKFAEAGSRIAHLSHQLNKIEEANEQLVAQAKLARDVICDENLLPEEIVVRLREQLGQLDSAAPHNSTDGKQDEDMADLHQDSHTDETYDQQKYLESYSRTDDEMQRLDRAIQEKYEVLQAANTNYENFVKKSEKEQSELKQKVSELEKEKEKQTSEIRKLSSSSKLAEERRRRVQELERQIMEDKKKLTEISRLQQKYKSEQEANKRLEEEIVNLKKQKVRLIKEMKAESEKYRVWKAQTDRTINKLKNQNRKREMEMDRERKQKDQQLAVFKQKYAEATQITKRLQEKIVEKNKKALEKPPATTSATSSQSVSSLIAQKRIGIPSTGLKPGNVVKFNPKQFIEYLELEVEIYQAKQVREAMVKQRTELNNRLKQLQTQLNDGETNNVPAKRSRGPDGSASNSSTDSKSEAERKAIEDEMTKIRSELQLCNDQIDSLFKSAMDAQDNNKANKDRWATITSIIDAKQALTSMFDDLVSSKQKLIDAQVKLDSEKQRLVQMQTKSRNQEADNQRELLYLDRKCDETKRDFETKLESLFALMGGESNSVDVVKAIDDCRQMFDKVNNVKEVVETRRSRRPCRTQSTSDLGLLTINEKRTRKKTEMFGDMRDTIKEIPGDEGESLVENTNIRDSTFNPLPQHGRKRKNRRILDISPIYGSQSPSRDESTSSGNKENKANKLDGSPKVTPKHRRDSLYYGRGGGVGENPELLSHPLTPSRKSHQIVSTATLQFSSDVERSTDAQTKANATYTKEDSTDQEMADHSVAPFPKKDHVPASLGKLTE